MSRTLVYYQTEAGGCPVEDFLGTLTEKEKAKVYWVLGLIEELDRVPAEYFKKLEGTDGIWECRIQLGGNAFRVFSFFFRGDVVVLTHGYAKKSEKTDRREIHRAEACRRDYLRRHGG